MILDRLSDSTIKTLVFIVNTNEYNNNKTIKTNFDKKLKLLSQLPEGKQPGIYLPYGKKIKSPEYEQILIVLVGSTKDNNFTFEQIKESVSKIDTSHTMSSSSIVDRVNITTSTINTCAIIKIMNYIKNFYSNKNFITFDLIGSNNTACSDSNIKKISYTVSYTVNDDSDSNNLQFDKDDIYGFLQKYHKYKLKYLLLKEKLN